MSLDQFRLDGRAALITGGGRGLGRSMALALAGAGADLVITSRAEEGARAAAAELAAATGRRVLGLGLEVTDAAQVEAVVQRALEAFGHIDILVNNAGINIRKPIDAFDEASWDLVQETNLKGPFLCMRAVTPHMKARGWGRIINVSSMLGNVALPERGAYSASKSGLLGLTRAVALELAPHGICVNALCPGPFATEINEAITGDAEKSRYFLERLPVGRWGREGELNGAVIFLASEASSFMTGASLVIDGGWTAQ